MGDGHGEGAVCKQKTSSFCLKVPLGTFHVCSLVLCTDVGCFKKLLSVSSPWAGLLLGR